MLYCVANVQARGISIDDLRLGDANMGNNNRVYGRSIQEDIGELMKS